MKPIDKLSISDKIISEINSIQLVSNEQIRARLMDLINELIQKDFNGLLQLLYRIDVDEMKIRSCLKENKNNDTASLLADLIIERQLQKIKTRQEYQSRNDANDNDEKW